MPRIFSPCDSRSKAEAEAEDGADAPRSNQPRSSNQSPSNQSTPPLPTRHEQKPAHVKRLTSILSSQKSDKMADADELSGVMEDGGVANRVMRKSKPKNSQEPEKKMKTYKEKQMTYKEKQMQDKRDFNSDKKRPRGRAPNGACPLSPSVCPLLSHASPCRR